MDLSALKWPVVFVVVVVGIWLLSNSGVAFMISNFTSATPGEDARRDRLDESGLSRVAGYLVITHQWNDAANVLRTTMNRYPNGRNYWYNTYRLAVCYEEMGRYAASCDLLKRLAATNAHARDPRVPANSVLQGRATKMQEVFELP